jgi:hypothetical protein
LGLQTSGDWTTWRRQQWEHVIPCFGGPPGVRRIIDTTNAIGSLHSRQRAVVRARGRNPNDEATIELWLLVMREVSREGKMPPREWAAAKTQFAVMVGERFITAWRVHVQPTLHSQFLTVPIDGPKSSPTRSPLSLSPIQPM